MTSLTNKIALFFPLNILLIFLAPVFAGASPTSLILITELQTGQGSSEFVEIQNTSDSDIDLKNWRLQYHSTSTANWSNKSLTFFNSDISIIKPGERALLVSSGYNPADSTPLASFPSGLADGGGSIRFIPSSIDLTLGDQLNWGNPDQPTCSIAPKHSSGQSLKRFPSGDGAFVDTSISGKDFYISDQPSPATIDTSDPFSPDDIVSYCAKPASSDTDSNSSSNPNTQPSDNNSSETPSDSSTNYPAIQITELFPDPVSPQTDEEDEYIELFNPGQDTVNLAGYKLQTGIEFNYSYTLPEIKLQPGQYYALSRKESRLTLSNTTSQARILDPSGEAIFQTDPYIKSNPGQSWQLLAGSWQWSDNPTQFAANLQSNSLTPTTAAVSSAKPKSKATPKKVAAKKPAAAKKATSTKKAAATKKDSSPSALTYKDDAGNTKLQPYILWGAGLLVLGYGLWEYRWDILRMFKKGQTSQTRDTTLL